VETGILNNIKLLQMTKTAPFDWKQLFWALEHLNFEFVSDLGFRTWVFQCQRLFILLKSDNVSK